MATIGVHCGHDHSAPHHVRCDVTAHDFQGMRLVGLSAYAPEQVWTNARVAARLRLERMRLRARTTADHGRDITPEEEKLFHTSDRWVRRFIGFSERRFAKEGEGTID